MAELDFEIRLMYNGLMVRKYGDAFIPFSVGLIGLTVVSALLVGGITVSADDSGTDRINVIIPSACTITGSGNSSHTATVSSNTYQADIGATTLKVICNDADGFAIYATGYTGEVVGDANNTKLIGVNTNQMIPTGIGTSGDSQWAMKLATDPTATYPVTIASAPNTAGGADASFSVYHVVPSEYTKVAYRLQGTDVGNAATGSILTTTYAVNISPVQVADTYIGKVKYTLVHPNDAPEPVEPLLETDCPANKICYAPNNGGIDGSMDSISNTKITKSPTAGVQTTIGADSSTAITSNSTITLIAPNYSLEGYGFAGWSTEFDAANATNPVIYGPNQTITTSTTAGTGDADVSEHGLILYPVWVASAGTMQSNASTVCSNLEAASYDSTSGTLSASLSSISALTDERDDNTYAIAKLADGNCWMIENLRLNADDTLGDTNKALAQGYGDDTTNNRGKFIGLADSEDANFTGSTSSATDPTNANSLYYAGTQSGTATMNIGQVDYAGSRIPRYNNNNTNRGGTNSAGTNLTISYNANTNSAQWYGYGNYYNWPAAIANTTGYSNPTASEVAGTSLCPTGWQLPYGRDAGNGALSKGFSYLDTRMGGIGASSSTNAATGDTMSTYWRQFPNNFVLSGYFYRNSSQSRAIVGHYQSSTAVLNNANSAYFLYLTSGSINPGTYSNQGKSNGNSVRCLISS